jgi:MYXO-CTERM domain-containing protein
LAGAFGNALNAALRPAEHSAIGASTAVFGALGLLAACAWRQRRRFEVGRLRRWTPIIGGVLLLGYTGTGGERTDVLAHVTGFLSGVATGVVFSALGRRIEFKPRSQAAIGLGTLAVLAVCWLLATNGG